MGLSRLIAIFIALSVGAFAQAPFRNVTADPATGALVFPPSLAGDGSRLASINPAPAWVMVSFGNEILHVSASYDFVSWFGISNFTSPSSAGGGGIRDPQILYHRGVWWVVWTESHNAAGTGTTFGLGKSYDLINWQWVADIDISAHMTSPHVVWQPMLVQDANGNAQCTVTSGDGHWHYLVPTDQNDLSTLTWVSYVSGTLPNITPSACYRVGSTYYVSGPTLTSTDLYTASSLSGPWTFNCTMATSSTLDPQKVCGSTFDSGNWYLFLNTDDPSSVLYALSPGSPSGFTSTVKLGHVVRRLNGPYASGENANATRCYDAAAAGVGFAIQSAQLAASVCNSPAVPLPRVPNIFASSGGGNGSIDSNAVNGASIIQAGTTSGGNAAVTLSASVDMSVAFTGAPMLLGGGRPFKMQCSIAISGDSSNPVNLLFGTTSNKLTQLDKNGYGLKFQSGTVSLLIHDGTTLHTYAGGSYNNNAVNEITVYAGGGQSIYVYVNGSLYFSRHDIPDSGTEDASYNYIVLNIQNAGGTATNAWFEKGTLQAF